MPVMLYQPYKIGDFSRLAFNKGLAVVVVGAPGDARDLAQSSLLHFRGARDEGFTERIDAIGEIADTLSLKFKLHPAIEIVQRWRGVCTSVGEESGKLRRKKRKK